LSQASIDILFQGVDLLLQIATQSEIELVDWLNKNTAQVDVFLANVTELTVGNVARKPVTDPVLTAIGALEPNAVKVAKVDLTPARARKNESSERVLRVTAENLNRLLGLPENPSLNHAGCTHLLIPCCASSAFSQM